MEWGGICETCGIRRRLYVVWCSSCYRKRGEKIRLETREAATKAAKAAAKEQ